jgi:hypothetical protein
MREGNSIDRISGFKVMDGSIDMSAGMGAQVQTGDKVVLVLLLPEDRGNIARIYEDTFRERARDIDNFHRSTHSIRTPR